MGVLNFDHLLHSVTAAHRRGREHMVNKIGV